MKASRRPNWKLSTAGNMPKGPNQQNRGRGQWRGRGGSWGGFRGGSSVGSSGSLKGNAGGRKGRGGRSYSANYDPLACYQCGVRGHLARDCPQVGTPSQGVAMLCPPVEISLNPAKRPSWMWTWTASSVQWNERIVRQSRQ